MKEYSSNHKNIPRTLNSNPQAHRQTSIAELLKTCKNGSWGKLPAQRASIEKPSPTKKQEQEYANSFIQPQTINIYADTTQKKTIQAKTISQNQKSASSSPILQRKVGMEFQTVGGTWNVAQVEKEDGREVEFNSLGHGTKLYQEGHYSVETDGKDLEYVTDAFDERTEAGIRALKNCASAAGTKHRTYCRGGGGFHVINPANLTDTREIPTKAGFLPEHNGWWVINRKGEKTAHPQATVGLKLESIHDFITKILSESMYLGKERTNLLETPKKAGADNPSARTTIREVNQIVKKQRDFDSQQKGFVNLVLQYLNMTTDFVNKTGSPGLVNAKNAMAFMSRTSLDQIFKQLKPTKQTQIIRYFKNLPAYQKGSSYLAYENGGEKVLFKNWVDQLERSKEDLLRGKFHSVSAITGPTDADDAIPSLSRATDIGYDSPEGDPIHGAIIELRALTHNVPSNKWGLIAEKVAKLVKTANTPSRR